MRENIIYVPEGLQLVSGLNEEYDENVRKEIRKDALEKLALIKNLKCGDGIIIGTNLEGDQGINYLRQYISSFNKYECDFIDSQKESGWEMKYHGKDYHVRIPKLKTGELYPEMIIKRRRK